MKLTTHTVIFSTLFLAFLACGLAAAQSTIYVDAAATGANDGTSWPDAYTDLQSALDHAAASNGQVKEIRVAQGTYRPTRRTDPNDPRSATFMLVDGVALRGGYAGSMSVTPDARDHRHHPTVLSGDVNGDDGPDGQSTWDNLSVVLSGYELGTDTVVEGLTLTEAAGRHGGALLLVDSSPLVTDCVFLKNGADRLNASVVSDVQTTCSCQSAAGVSIWGARSPRFKSCRFEGNFGAMSICDGSASLENCAFHGNTSFCGAAILLGRAQISIHACTFSRNVVSYDYGGAIATDRFPTEIVISDCEFDWNSAARLGGAIHAYGARLLSIADTVFDRNESWAGGAVFAFDTEQVRISQSVFESNRSAYGGAIAVEGYQPGAQDATIEDCTFSWNTADGHGGAIYATAYSSPVNRTLEVHRCTFAVNRATEGGGISIERGVQSSLIVGSVFQGNQAALGGGASMNSGSVLGCAFLRNTATVGAAISALYDEGPVRIANTLFTENEAEAFGGAVAGGSQDLQVAGCTIARNIVRAGGAGVFGSYDLALSGSIIWNNELLRGDTVFRDQLAQLDVLGFETIQHNTIENWTGSPGGIGNDGIDPMFTVPNDPDGEYGLLRTDFHLLPGSPAIDSGDPDYVAEPGETDLDGKPRVLCGRVDRGAYEYGLVGDIDCDRAVTLADFHEWTGCETGPGEPIALGDCQALDAHTDGLLHDFAGFANGMSE